MYGIFRTKAVVVVLLTTLVGGIIVLSYLFPSPVERICGSILPGFSRQQVEQILIKEELPHSWIEFDHCYIAMVRGSTFTIVQSDYQIRIHFDAGDRVTRVEVRRVLTGP